MPVFNAKVAMWSRKESVCSAVSGASRGEDYTGGLKLYPFAVGLRVRVLQIVCGIGSLVVGAVGWIEERKRLALGLGVPAGAVTVMAAATSVYYSRGFGGWLSARSMSSPHWGSPWRALGPSPLAAVPLTLLWAAAIAAHLLMVAYSIRSLVNIETSSSTNTGVASAQLLLSAITLLTQMYMFYLDLRFDAAVSPPVRQSESHTVTAVSMVPLASVAINTCNSDDGTTKPNGSPQEKEPPEPPA